MARVAPTDIGLQSSALIPWTSKVATAFNDYTAWCAGLPDDGASGRRLFDKHVETRFVVFGRLERYLHWYAVKDGMPCAASTLRGRKVPLLKVWEAQYRARELGLPRDSLHMFEDSFCRARETAAGAPIPELPPIQITVEVQERMFEMLVMETHHVTDM